MASEINSNWLKAEFRVKLYSRITVFAVLYGIAAAHIPFLIGHSWTTCKVCGSELGCVLTFHLYEVPLVSYNAFVAWYGLKKFSHDTLQNYMSLLTFAVMANLVFFTFETELIFDSLCREAPLWETLALYSVAIILLAGAGLGIYVKQILVETAKQEN